MLFQSFVEPTILDDRTLQPLRYSPKSAHSYGLAATSGTHVGAGGGFSE